MEEDFSKHYNLKRKLIITLSGIILLSVFLFKNASFPLRASTAIGFIVLFYLIDHFYDVRFKPIHYFFVILIAISTLLLSPLYYIYANYDKLQHLIIPILIFSIIFHTVNKLKLKLKWKLVFSFFITFSILGLFEIGEYALDYLFDLKLQGVFLRDLEGIDKLNLIINRIDDTMIDLLLGLAGTFIGTIYTLIKIRKIKNKKT